MRQTRSVTKASNDEDGDANDGYVGVAASKCCLLLSDSNVETQRTSGMDSGTAIGIAVRTAFGIAIGISYEWLAELLTIRIWLATAGGLASSMTTGQWVWVSVCPSGSRKESRTP